MTYIKTFMIYYTLHYVYISAIIERPMKKPIKFVLKSNVPMHFSSLSLERMTPSLSSNKLYLSLLCRIDIYKEEFHVIVQQLVSHNDVSITTVAITLFC